MWRLPTSCMIFFFQAEDGIRDRNVTGVQTCALPISGGRARLSATLRARTPTEAVVSGTLGSARLSGAFFAPSTLTVTLLDGRSASAEHPWAPGDGLAYEIAEAARRLTAGELESPLMTWECTLSGMGTRDAMLAALGVVYPGEEPA